MSLRKTDLLIGALVLASLGANGLLLSRWRAARSAEAVDAGLAGATGGTGRRAGHLPVRLDGCGLRAAAIEGRFAEVMRLRDQYLPPSLRWEDAALNESLTSALRTELAKHVAAGAPALQAECREELCRLFAGETETAAIASFMRSPWRGQHLREVESDASGLLLRHRDPGAIAGGELLQRVLQDFEASGAVETCQTSFKGERSGTVDAELTVAMDGEAAALTVQTGGLLASTPLGKCIAGELNRAIAAVTLPDRVERAVVMAQYPRR